MGKQIFLVALSACLAFLLTACAGQNPPPDEGLPAKETVALTVWGAEEDEALLEQIFSSFKTHYAGQADFQITYQPQSESNCKDALLADLEGGADVFAFADAGRRRRTGPHRGCRGHPQRLPSRRGGGGQRGRDPLCLPADGR